MFDHIERRYLLRMARVFKLRGLNRAEARRAIMIEIGPICCENSVRCAVRHVFQR